MSTNPVREADLLDAVFDLAWLAPVTDPRTYGRDASNPYYDFLYRLSDFLHAERILELGTCTGGSTSFLARGRPAARVYTVDTAPLPMAVERLSSFANVEMIRGDTLSPKIVEQVRRLGPFDLLFIDTLHEYEQLSGELALYQAMVRPGGVIAFDDIRINEGMARFWRELALPKRELNHLHKSGFGIAVVPPEL